MSDAEELAYRRVDKLTDNTKVKPIDLLRAATHALESGEENFTSVIILTRETKVDGSIATGGWRCGITRDQEMMMYVLAEHELINRMRESQ